MWCFDLFLYVCNSNTVIKTWFSLVAEISAKCIQVYQVYCQRKLLSNPCCATKAKYKHNIVKHLKSCYSVNKNRGKGADNKICKACGKEFSKMSNRNRLFQQFHAENNHGSAAQDEITEKGTERSQKKELLVKIMQIYTTISYLLEKMF